MKKKLKKLKKKEYLKIVKDGLHESPVSIATTTVNQEGLFEFSKLDSGLYNIEAYHSTTGKRNININIDVFNDSIQQIQSFMHTNYENNFNLISNISNKL